MGPICNNIDVIQKGKHQQEMATHAVQFIYQAFNGFRWPLCYYASTTATAPQLFHTFWDVVDNLEEMDFICHYVMMDGATTNRSFTKLHFELEARLSNWTIRNMFNRNNTLAFIQDIKHCLKKLRNNVESSRMANLKGKGRCLILHGKYVVWDHWEQAFAFNNANVVRLHRKLTKEHITINPHSKMRNHLATDVLDRNMLYLMQCYQSSLPKEERANLNSTITLLEMTSVLVDIFEDRIRSLSSASDDRVSSICKVLDFFKDWDSSDDKAASNSLTKETMEDIQCSLQGFLTITHKVTKLGISFKPGYFNSDSVENFFCQQRGMRNGQNTNPTISQYGPGVNAIILGQASISRKGNAGNGTDFFKSTMPRPLRTDRKPKRPGMRL